MGFVFSSGNYAFLSDCGIFAPRHCSSSALLLQEPIMNTGCEGSEQAVSPGNRMKPPEVNGKTDSSITLLGMHQALREYL